jgi:hypothetical protein
MRTTLNLMHASSQVEPVFPSKMGLLQGRQIAKANDTNTGSSGTWKKTIYIFLITISSAVTFGLFAPQLLITAIVILPTVFLIRALIQLNSGNVVLSESQAKENRTFSRIMGAAKVLLMPRRDLSNESELENFKPDHPIIWGRFQDDGRLFFVFNHEISERKFSDETAMYESKKIGLGVACCMMKEARVDSVWTFSKTTAKALKDFFRELDKKEEHYSVEAAESDVIERVMERLFKVHIGLTITDVDTTKNLLVELPGN